jgi:hypothetical protein
VDNPPNKALRDECQDNIETFSTWILEIYPKGGENEVLSVIIHSTKAGASRYLQYHYLLYHISDMISI